MSIGSGLASQIGFATESVVGTAQTVTRFFPFESETIELKPGYKQAGGMRAGAQLPLSGGFVQTYLEAGGDINLDFPAKGAGLLLQHMLGSFGATATQMGATAAYQQIHVLGADTGKTFTTQKGAPRTDGTVEPITYPGCKFTGWELDCATGDIVKLKLTVDAANELSTATTPAGPALASASYSTGLSFFNFTQGALISGGTPTLAAGVYSLVGGAAVAAVRAINLKGSIPRAGDRQFLGSMTKAEQIANGWLALTGTVDVEFANRVMYDLWRSNVVSGLQLTFTGPVIGTPNKSLLDWLLPFTFLTGKSPNVDNPDILTMQIPFQAFTADTAVPPIQVLYQSTDTVV